MNLPDSVTIPADVMSRQVGDECVLLHLATGNYYGLDSVGTRLWRLMSEAHTPADACEILLQEYDVEPARLQADIRKLLDDLAARGLVQLR
jgi:hypothetical protein